MKRLAFCLVAILAATMPAAAFSTGFGLPGEPAFGTYVAPSNLPYASDAGEPTIGIPWNTDSVFLQAFAATYRVRFNASQALWEDVTPPNSIVNVDPMLHADPDAGRVWAGGLAGPCSIMAFSDDDGETWTPTGNMCSGAQFDHQSIGSGPYSDIMPVENPVFPHAVYYCAQLGFTACATSHDGGLSWLPFTEVLGACGGLHGHIRVSRVTGTAAVPDNSCGGEQGFAYTQDNGLTWSSRTVEGSQASDGGFDPSLQFGRDEGWLWFGQGNSDGAHIALSKDDGVTWEPLGAGMGVEATTWLDVGQYHDPPIVRATFSDVQVGDDDRVAFAFLGLEDQDGNGRGDEYPNSNQCDDRQEVMIWHYYVAMSLDGGDTWSVHRASDDPVQVGGIWDGGGGDPCRNLLDFNDMDIDSRGRLYLAFADGCIEQCAEQPDPRSGGYRSSYATMIRQETGRGLFAAFDSNVTAAPVEPDAEETPAIGVLGLLAAVGVALVRRRR